MKRGADIFNITRRNENIVNRHDELLRNLTESVTGGV